MNSPNSVQFGWEIPNGNRRMPSDIRKYIPRVRRVLDRISGHFHSAWIPDHFMNDRQDNFPESLTTLSYLAGLYPDLHFGPVVLGQNYRNPALLAKMAATLQTFSNGRFVLGLGAGWHVDEYRAYNFEFPGAAARIAQLAEVVQICKLMWNPAQPAATFHGRHYRVDGAACFPKPQPPPPVMIGGAGEKRMLRVIAQHADWWNLVGVSPETYAHKIRVLENHCAKVGRNPAGIRRTWMGVVSIAATQRQAEAALANYPIWPEDVAIVGTPPEVAARLREYTALGVDLFIVAFADEPAFDGLELFIRDVMPEFQA